MNTNAFRLNRQLGAMQRGRTALEQNRLSAHKMRAILLDQSRPPTYSQFRNAWSSTVLLRRGPFLESRLA
jgi:hypothetical protein